MLRICILAAFAIIGMVQLVLLDSIRTRLSAKHPDAFSAITEKSSRKRLSTVGSAIARFVWSRGDRKLKDADLTRLVMVSKILYVVLLFVFVAMIFQVFLSVKS